MYVPYDETVMDFPGGEYKVITDLIFIMMLHSL